MNPLSEKTQKVIIVTLLFTFAGSCIWLLFSNGYNPFKNFSKSEMLPPHTVKTTTYKSIGFTDEGGKVLVESSDPKLSREDCIKLANKYKPVAGQVGVHKPAKDGNMVPFCVDNVDGKGVFFPFDSLF